MQKIEIISALVIACTGLITAVGLCLRRLHLRKIKSLCCDIEMAETPRNQSIDNTQPNEIIVK